MITLIASSPSCINQSGHFINYPDLPISLEPSIHVARMEDHKET